VRLSSDFKCPLNVLQVQSSPVVGLLSLASGQACFGMAFSPFLMKHLYRCDLVVIASFVEQDIPRGEDDCWVGEATALRVTTPCTPAGYTWTDHKTNTEIAKQLNITPVLVKIQNYKRNWIQHVN
jgi:hypothetical protein